MKSLGSGWLVMWVVYLAGGGVLAFRSGPGIIALCFAGFIFFIINAEVFRKQLKKQGVERKSFTRNGWYLPLVLGMLAAVVGGAILLRLPVSLVGFVLAVALIQAGGLWGLKLIGQDISQYRECSLLDVLYPLVFMTIPVVDWVDRGGHPLLLLVGPLVFFILALALLREFRLLMPVQGEQKAHPACNIL